MNYVNSLKEILQEPLTNRSHKITSPKDYRGKLQDIKENGRKPATSTGLMSIDKNFKWYEGFVYCFTGYPGCFTKEQLVHTKKGVQPISEIKIGDDVLSYNHEKKINEFRRVINTPVHETHREKLYRIKMKDGSLIEVTGNHEFFNGHSYVKIKDILLSLSHERNLEKG